MEPDFSGYATKADLKCSDGRTIMKDAFAHQDGAKVPLVWMHGHNEPTNILGYAILHAEGGDVRADAFLNKTPQGVAAKAIVQHGDVESLSIWANQLVEKSKQVFHGAIKEVSLVLSGANPGAKIDYIRVAHSADPDDFTELNDEARIFTGLPLIHSDSEAAAEENKEGEEENAGENEGEETEENSEETAVEHADTKQDGPTVQDVYDSLTPEQKDVVHFMIGTALEEASGTNAAHSDTNNDEDPLVHQEGTEDMTRNLFENNGGVATAQRPHLSHDQMSTILDDAKKPGMTLKDSFMAHADEYGITDINLLFPDAKALSNEPDFISRRMEWVATVLDGTKHAPFSKIKSIVADITAEEARAKGYIKGNQKKEEVFPLLRRTTSPATIYKKQKLDRDDIIDITDLDVVAWLKAEMRLMIEEEVARAILVGDGRDTLSEDKVKDPGGAATDGVGIRSIMNDSDLYAIKTELAANVSPKDAVKGMVRARSKYRGSGKPTLFISDGALTDIMLEEDKFGRPLYATEQELADKLRVSGIVTVDLFDEYEDLFAIMVSLTDYTVGTTNGGELTSFEDFDIDFNQNKYLQETRLSGALTKPYSAIVVRRAQGTEATPAAPSFDGATDTITIPTTTGVTYTINDETVTGNVTITEATEVDAHPADGYYFPSNVTRTWTYTV